MRLLLDEMHAPAVADALAADGYDVMAVAATATLRGLPDDALLEHAASEQRVLVTENVVDFAVLVERWAVEGREHAGVVFTNPKRYNRATVAYPGNLIAALRAMLDQPPALGQSGTWWL